MQCMTEEEIGLPTKNDNQEADNASKEHPLEPPQRTTHYSNHYEDGTFYKGGPHITIKAMATDKFIGCATNPTQN